MKNKSSFSETEKNEIRSIVREELIPVNQRLDNHDILLHKLVEISVQNTHDIKDIKEEISRLPTMDFILTYMDSSVEEREMIKQELITMGRIVQRHDQDIYGIKKLMNIA